jgi:hypothetical protein
VVLSKGLFKDGHPHGTVVSNLAEHSVSMLDGNPFVNNDSVGSTKGKEVDSVDSCIVQLLLFVKEHLLDTAWFLSKSGGTRQDPAVAKTTLFDIVGNDTVFTPKMVVLALEDFVESLPLVALNAPLFSLVRPEE